MSLSRAAIVDQLKEIVGADRVITDETVLKKNSIDRFRKFPDIHGIYTLPIPAAVVKLGSTEQVSRVLNFMNAHKINGVPRTGASATEGGLETVVENSVVLDGSAMNQIINIDIENMQATAQCGVPLEVLENALREKGYTTGHSPQSKPLAQMGGLVATRSIIGSSARVVDYVITLGNARITTLATAPGAFCRSSRYRASLFWSPCFTGR